MTATRVEPPMTPQEIAALTGLHYQTVLAEIHAGQLRAKKVRGHYLILPEHYQAWLEPDDPPSRPERAPTPAPARSTGRPTAGSVAALTAIEEGEGP